MVLVHQIFVAASIRSKNTPVSLGYISATFAPLLAAGCRLRCFRNAVASWASLHRAIDVSVQPAHGFVIALLECRDIWFHPQCQVDIAQSFQQALFGEAVYFKRMDIACGIGDGLVYEVDG